MGDADTLDGQEGSWYQDLGNATGSLDEALIDKGPADTILITRSGAEGVEPAWTTLVAGDLPSHSHSWGDVNKSGSVLADIANVTITGIAAGELLKWSGSAWINNTLAEAGIAASGHNHDATYLGITDTADNSVLLGGNTLAQVRDHPPASHDFDVHTGKVDLVDYTGGPDETFLHMAGSTITWAAIASVDIPNLNASKITAGTFADARIPNLATSKITSGVFVSARLSGAYTGITGLGTLTSLTISGQGTHTIHDNGSKSANFNIDANNGNVQRVTIGASSIAATFTNLTQGSPIQLLVEWGGTYTGFTIAGADYGDAGTPSWSGDSAKADWAVVMKFNNITNVSVSTGHGNPT